MVSLESIWQTWEKLETVEVGIATIVLLALWGIGLVISLGLIRTVMILFRQLSTRQIKPGMEHGPNWYWRFNRAHANITENLAFYAIAIGAATYYQTVPAALFKPLCLAVFLGRVWQTFWLLLSSDLWAILPRFAGFAVQQFVSAFFLLSVVLRIFGHPLSF
jgi:hypothetical protein